MGPEPRVALSADIWQNSRVCGATLRKSEVQIDERPKKACISYRCGALLTSLSSQAQWKTRWEYEGARGPDRWK